MQEIGALAAGETAGAEDAALGLNKINRLFDSWNAQSQFIYGTLLFQGTLTPNHNPHTLGTSGADYASAQAKINANRRFGYNKSVQGGARYGGAAA